MVPLEDASQFRRLARDRDVGLQGAIRLRLEPIEPSLGVEHGARARCVRVLHDGVAQSAQHLPRRAARSPQGIIGLCEHRQPFPRLGKRLDARTGVRVRDHLEQQPLVIWRVSEGIVGLQT